MTAQVYVYMYNTRILAPSSGEAQESVFTATEIKSTHNLKERTGQGTKVLHTIYKLHALLYIVVLD